MEIRHPIHPEHGKALDTAGLRQEFLIQELFTSGTVKMVYSHIDRIVICGIMPVGEPLGLQVDREVFGVDYFLERRELGVINVGGPGSVSVDGTEYPLDYKDGLYVGMGSRELLFISKNPDNPSKFYCLSGTAHKRYETSLIQKEKAREVRLGSDNSCNKRVIRQLIHPEVLPSCQLVMGYTELAEGNVWNTMPAHTHERRMEVYFYFEIDPDQAVFHLMGEPSETRHILVRNEEAIISPSWSIHSGVGTGNYTFIWGMVGENQTFDDMDGASMDDLA
ncbi:5-dehydro-4-deoxy-D-glucuronate isomerase [Marispirochaeta sp.]|uniref:5-dehydro-4-deoxy-D-glucuronate isomerase n=1 Tax=Marispirochaeta sp. TaxID=2038653 RepID=UPI0029C6A057|nr:5-dehydro-4-deoxy-D-glucuronate isomerase [Marispirochaeta sp.]